MTQSNIVTTRPQPGVMAFDCRACREVNQEGTFLLAVSLEEKAAVEAGAYRTHRIYGACGHTLTVHLRGLVG